MESVDNWKEKAKRPQMPVENRKENRWKTTGKSTGYPQYIVEGRQISNNKVEIWRNSAFLNHTLSQRCEKSHPYYDEKMKKCQEGM